jgi:hypothetical protein
LKKPIKPLKQPEKGKESRFSSSPEWLKTVIEEADFQLGCLYL